jgi:hypothetical protein
MSTRSGNHDASLDDDSILTQSELTSRDRDRDSRLYADDESSRSRVFLAPSVGTQHTAAGPVECHTSPRQQEDSASPWLSKSVSPRQKSRTLPASVSLAAPPPGRSIPPVPSRTREARKLLGPSAAPGSPPVANPATSPRPASNSDSLRSDFEFLRSEVETYRKMQSRTSPSQMPARPDHVKASLDQSAGQERMQASETGLVHADERTDGSHAAVAATSDWAKPAPTTAQVRPFAL